MALVIFILLMPKVPLLTIPGGYSTPIRVEDLLVAIVVLLGLYLVVTNRQYRDCASKVARSPISLLIILLISLMSISTTLNFISSGLTANAFFIVLRFVEYFSFFYLGYLGATTANLHWRFLRILLLVSVPINLYGVLQRIGLVGGFGGGFYQYDYIKGTDRAFSTFSGPYEFAGFLIVVIPMSVAMILVTQKLKRRAEYVTIWVLAVMALAFSGARFPVFAVVPAILSLILITRETKRKLAVVVLAVLTMVVPFFLSDTLVTRFSPIVTVVKTSVEEYQKTSREKKSIAPTETPIPTPIATLPIVPSPRLETVVKETSPAATLQTPAPEEREEKPPSQAATPHQVELAVGRATDWVSQKSLAVISSFENTVNTVTGQLELLSGSLQDKDPSLRWRLGETWPRALVKLKSNPLLGGGMGSVGIGLDGEYATLLGEIGLLGLGVFLTLLTMVVLILQRETEKEDNQKKKVLFFATIVVLLGLALDGVFVDIFRASKIAMLFWYLVGLSAASQERHDFEHLTR